MNFNSLWYDNHPLGLALIPLSWLFCVIVWIRRQAYKYGLLTIYHAPVPVIIVGNITVGGTGKTPLVSWLGQFLRQQGLKPGIVSRGYGGHAKKWPQPVYKNSDPYLVGDEPVLLARHSGCPVAVAPQRSKAVQSLLKNYDCDIIISDDGLQHYALHRDIEIAVFDNTRRHGNQRCLPAGPLREPVNRLKQVNFLVISDKSNQFTTHNSSESFTIHNSQFTIHNYSEPLRRITNEDISQPLSALHNQTVHAVAGIGNPAQFFAGLQNHGLKLYCHEFGDHHQLKKSDIQFNDDLPVIMTEKDAVKCRQFAGPQHWYLPIKATVPNSFGERLLQQIEKIQNG